MPSRPLLAAALLSVLWSAPARAGDPPPEEVRLLAAEIAALGTEAQPWFAVDLGRLTVVEQTRDELRTAALPAELDRLRPDGRRAARQALLRAWGREQGDDLTPYLAALPARWLRGSGQLVLVKGAGAPEGLASRGLLVAHELVRAWQDQRPAAEVEGEGTSEQTWLREALREGQAGAVALAVSRARIRSSLREVEPDSLQVPAEAQLLGPLQALLLRTGRAFAVRAYQTGGWAALRDLPRPPASTEQLLHPPKLGRDAPTPVDRLPWPAAAGRGEELDQDVLGELALTALLLELELPPDEATRVALGWDGDRLAVWRTPDGRLALAWRTVWDREQDAQQLVAALEKRWKGRWETHGRAVDAVWADGDAELESALAKALRGLPRPVGADEADATSTAELERELVRRDVLGTRRWTLREEGISLPIPPQWSLRTVQGRTYLMARVEQDFADNLNVILTGNVVGNDGEALARQLRLELEGAGGKVLSVEQRRGPRGEPAVLAEYSLRYQGRPLRFMVLVIARGEAELVITATTTEEGWEGRKELFRAILEDVRGAE